MLYRGEFYVDLQLHGLGLFMCVCIRLYFDIHCVAAVASFDYYCALIVDCFAFLLISLSF